MASHRRAQTALSLRSGVVDRSVAATGTASRRFKPQAITLTLSNVLPFLPRPEKVAVLLAIPLNNPHFPLRSLPPLLLLYPEGFPNHAHLPVSLP